MPSMAAESNAQGSSGIHGGVLSWRAWVRVPSASALPSSEGQGRVPDSPDAGAVSANHRLDLPTMTRPRVSTCHPPLPGKPHMIAFRSQRHDLRPLRRTITKA